MAVAPPPAHFSSAHQQDTCKPVQQGEQQQHLQQQDAQMLSSWKKQLEFWEGSLPAVRGFLRLQSPLTTAHLQRFEEHILGKIHELKGLVSDMERSLSATGRSLNRSLNSGWLSQPPQSVHSSYISFGL